MFTQAAIKGFRGKRASAYDFFDGNLVELKNVHSFLEKMEKESDTLIQRATDHKKDSSIACHQETFLSPRVRDLMKKTPVELAHQVHTLNLQIDDQKKGIKLLRETLREEKQKTEELRLSHKEAMEKANAEAEVLVQRHQKFIKQVTEEALLNEKKNLNETVTNLVSDLKLKEEKFKKNMKAMEERHQIEVKRAKEAQATADKIKREKWMESKTQKIKEMTVKGLEPELTRMAAIQQEQIQELKALQKVELETVKEKAAEKTSVLLEDLRMDLLRERTTAIARETENLRIRMEKEFQVERDQYENTIKKLREHIKIEEEKLNDQETAFSHRMLKCRREFDDEKERMVRDFNEKSDETRRHHEVELGKLRESLEAEKEIWMINSKKQEEMKLLEREGELREQCKRDRDREIERVIDMVEKEYSRQQSELNEETENKLKKLRLKFESEMKEAEANENFLKEKLSKVKCQLAGKEETIAELNSEIRQLQGDLTFQKKRCKEMTSERSNLTDIIRREFETKLDEMDKGREVLEKEMQALREKHLLDLAKKDELNLKVKNEMQRELTKVYSR
ncbi:hypothetical protein RUM43_005510 [Polyplax serrata]|uniref:Uncharacterized protein n=1 Tax=Polyplax serrata TaxID=468196 RepID=A0AAN8NWU9_POLSC